MSPLGLLGRLGKAFQEGGQICARDDRPRAILSDSQPPFFDRLVKGSLSERTQYGSLRDGEAELFRGVSKQRFALWHLELVSLHLSPALSFLSARRGLIARWSTEGAQIRLLEAKRMLGNIRCPVGEVSDAVSCNSDS
jgi:hypothetical protein